MQNWSLSLPALVIAIGATLGTPAAYADNDDNTLVPNNKRLNDGVVANVYTVQHQAGCTNDVKINPQLQQAAQRHATDVLNDRDLDGDVGSDGSTPQNRADAAGYRGKVAETVAINPALAISGARHANAVIDASAASAPAQTRSASAAAVISQSFGHAPASGGMPTRLNMNPVRHAASSGEREPRFA